MSSISTTSTKKKTTTSTSDLLLLGLGSNLGPSEEILRWAIGETRRFLEPALVEPLCAASLYRSAPVSEIPQSDFLNTALGGHLRRPRSILGPEEILAFTKALELRAGRERGSRWGPRRLDIDLLLYGDQRLSRPELTLPHPRLSERRFVLLPLVDLYPEALLDGGENGPETVRQRLERLSGQEVEEVGWRVCPGR